MPHVTEQQLKLAERNQVQHEGWEPVSSSATHAVRLEGLMSGPEGVSCRIEFMSIRNSK